MNFLVKMRRMCIDISCIICIRLPIIALYNSIIAAYAEAHVIMIGLVVHIGAASV